MTARQPSIPLSLDAIIEKTKSEELFTQLELPDGFKEHWDTTEADQDFAWQLYTELRTRIATQPLHFMHGKEKVALKSLYELFPLVRKLIHEKGRPARNAVTLSLAMINKVVRPFTAKWDGRTSPDIPLREDDGTEFRNELDALQNKIRSFASMLACIAEQDGYIPETESWPTKSPVKPNGEYPAESEPIPFAIQFHASVPKDVAAEISKLEEMAIAVRRKAVGSTTTSECLEDVAGLSISGGGIRSASFALGVVQELSRHNVLQHFDYLSTVSGGGYLGSFLSSYLNGAPVPKHSSNEKVAFLRDVVLDRDIGLGSKQLPLNRPQGSITDDSKQNNHRVQSESAPIRHVRGHSKYLLTGGWKIVCR